MFSHVMVGARDCVVAREFYDATLGALGCRPGRTDDKGRLFYTHDHGLFMVSTPINGQAASGANGGTIGFSASSTAAVDAWHAAGLAHGGTAIEDPPGIRRNAFGSLYVAYLRDPSGNKVCALHRMTSD